MALSEWLPVVSPSDFGLARAFPDSTLCPVEGGAMYSVEIVVSTSLVFPGLKCEQCGSVLLLESGK